MEPIPLPKYPAGKRELTHFLVLLILGTGLWNSIFWGGLNLGFALCTLALMGCSARYLKNQGARFDRYSRWLLILSAVLAGGFARGDDAGLKAWLALVLLVSVNLSFCLAAGQNRRDPGSLSSLLGAPRALFVLGYGGMGKSARSLRAALRDGGSAGKKGGAVLVGLLLALPLMAAMGFLLMRSDAAFEALVDSLPRLDLSQGVISLFFGLFYAWVAISRSLGLLHSEKVSASPRKKAMDPLTWNIVLGAASVLYCVYFLSQLSYFGGGFAGNLPQGYTLAQYARRGFFEMAWLGAINLGLICLAMGLSAGENLRLTRTLCLFLSGVTLFLAAASSAKMILYIRGFGLTRLRVLTEVFMIWLAVTTVLTMIWLFRRDFGYMKGAVLTALILSAALLWADVDTQVARYNVRAYQRGALEAIDIAHLSSLGDGALPYLAELREDPELSETVNHILSCRHPNYGDLRGWNFSTWKAGSDPYHGKEGT